MALYHFYVTQIKRSAGRRVSEAAAYRAGEKIYSDYYGMTFDYSRKGGVVHKEILLPPNAPQEYEDRATLWDAVENAEHTKKAQLAYSFDIALQNEFTQEENIALARQFVQEQFVAKGMIADLCVHMSHKDDGEDNPHFHVLCPIRPLNPGGTWGAKQRREYLFDENGDPILDDSGHQKFNAVPTTDWWKPETLEAWRSAWAEMCNRKFEEKELDTKIDHRSYERQGIDQIPTVHEGPNVRKMEAKGIQTEKGALNRWIRKTNRMIANIKAIIKELLEAIDELNKERAKFDAENIATLLNTYYDRRNAGAYSSKARANNLQEQIDTFNYLQARGINTLDDLKETVSKIGDRVWDRQKAIRDRQERMRELTDLIRYAENYQRLKPIYDEMNAIRWTKKREKYKQKHDSDLRIFYLARRKLDEYQKGKKSVPLPAWRQEYADLEKQNKTDYAELKQQRAELAKLKNIEKKLESALRPEPQRHREQER